MSGGRKFHWTQPTSGFGQCANAEVEVFGTCIMDFDGNSEAVSQVIKASHEMCETTERTHSIRATFR